MISERQIAEILAQYEKHGWSLRRVLISAETKRNLSESLFGDAEKFDFDINALWFSRLSNPGRETWELRYLAATPFALVEVFEADEDEAAREETRQEMQTRLLEMASKYGRQK